MSENRQQGQLLTKHHDLFRARQSINVATACYYKSRHHPWGPDTAKGLRRRRRRESFGGAAQTRAVVGDACFPYPAWTVCGGRTFAADGGALAARDDIGNSFSAME